ncbi:MAG: M13 family metallopeptidase [Bacteroidales bacterium]|nr:M13 family metallopeptidase [Bacteroidales bacterium]
MKRILFYSTIMAVTLFAACGNKNESQNAELTSGIDLSNMDTTANPADDFYQYACGGWMKNNPLTAEYSRYGAFDKLAEQNREQLKELIEDIAKAKNDKGSNAEKIATIYNMGMDSVTLQKQGAEPLKPWLDEIVAIKDAAGINAEIIKLHQNGIDPFFGIFAEPDHDNSKITIAWMWQAGLGMDRDYYVGAGARNQELRTKYVQMIANMFKLAGFDKLIDADAKFLADKVMAIEMRLAKAQYDKETLRNPHMTFHKKTLDETQALAKNFPFGDYFKAIGLPEMKSLNVAQPEYIQEVGRVLATAKIDDLKCYLAWNVINTASGFLSDDFTNESFEFYGRTLSGREEMRPRWKRVTGTVEGVLGEAVGQLYVEKYFPATAKERMLTLVNNLKDAFKVRIKEATWMNDTTKQKATEKLDAILIKVGYPDKWRDYSTLKVENDSYFANVLRSNQFDLAYMVSKIDKPTDRDEWQMTPQTINAYYNPSTNEICFPAGILQPPFFDMNADDAVNYGAIGVVIGHEMTHGFDDQGRQYDKDGNLSDWWLPGDAQNFKDHAQVLVDWFNAIKVLDDPETYANGKITLGENIADNGGLQISYVAMQNAIKAGQVNAEKMDGFTPEQRFFIAYATVWASNIRDEEIQRLTTEDVHSLGRWRVNGTLPHIAAFIEAFNIKEGDKMYLAPEKQAQLW